MSYFHMIFFYFCIYSFLGWNLEGLFNLFTRGHFIKSNFLILPLKPMYGIASVLLVLIKDFVPLGIFVIACLIIPSLIEYITAYSLFQSFGLKYWDYSESRYNVSGYICLRFSIYWMFLSLILVYWIHPLIHLFYVYSMRLWVYIFPITLLLLLIDFCLTLKNKTRFPV